MFASPARLVGKEAHEALTATYGGKTPSAGNWIGATNDDDGIAMTWCFSKATYATPTLAPALPVCRQRVSFAQR